MERFWRGTTKDGKFVTEAQGAKWDDYATDMQSLELVIGNRVIKLPKGMEYVQAKTCGASLMDGNCEIESRYIGAKIGNNTVLIRVNEKTENINIEIF